MIINMVLCAVVWSLTTTVFASGDGGFPEIRIPSLTYTAKGTILALAEGRDGSGSDQQHNQIVLRRSHDRGATWDKLQVVAAPPNGAYNNPCTVQDRRNGRVLVMFQHYPGGHKEADGTLKPGHSGPDVVTSWVVASDDEGKTWTRPQDITAQVKRPTVATTLCSGPGVGIQLTKGRHRGRLVVPFNQGPFYQWQVYAAYSDDGGRSWKCGADVPGAIVDTGGKRRSQVNEVQCVERGDGSLLMVSRQFAGNQCRRAAVSKDGGETWSPVYEIPELTDPSCMGSVLRLGDRILYSGPDAKDRRNGTVWVSRDQGKTWPTKRVVEPGAFAYSVLADLGHGQVGCLYETDDYRRIVFTVLSGL